MTSGQWRLINRKGRPSAQLGHSERDKNEMMQYYIIKMLQNIWIYLCLDEQDSVVMSKVDFFF